jgi:hypothetical protein
MLTWLKSFWFRPTATVEPSPQEVKEERKKIIILPRGRHTLSPYKVLDWWNQPPQLDPLPPFPPKE